MIYLLIGLLLAGLIYLLRLQHRQESAWQQELTRLDPAAPNEQAAQNRSAPEANLSGNDLIFHLADKPIPKRPAKKTPKKPATTHENLPQTIELPLKEPTVNQSDTAEHTTSFRQPETAAAATDTRHQPETPHHPLEIISLDVATRFMHRSALPQPDAPPTSASNAEIITLDDPNIARVIQRTQQKTDPLSPNAAPCVQLVAPISPHPQPEHNPVPADVGQHDENHFTRKTPLNRPLREIKTIQYQDIQIHLQRQRLARQKLAAHNAHPVADELPPAPLSEIPADEMWANLSKTHVSNTRQQRNLQETTPASQNNETINTAPTAIATRSTRAMPQHKHQTWQPEPEPAPAQAVFMPQTPVANPETVPPVVYPDTPLQAFAPDVPVSEPQPENTPAYLRREPVSHQHPIQAADDTPNPNDDNWTEQLNALNESPHPADTSNDDNEEDWAEKMWQEAIAASQTNTDTRHNRLPENILPPLSLLASPIHNPKAAQSPESLLENSIIIEEKLAEFRVKVKVLDAYAGPVITRYEVEPDVGVRGNSVLSLEKDLARSLGVAAIRVVETIPGKTCMGLELPNPVRQMIRLREIFNSPAFSGSASKLTLALGQDISGAPVVTDLAKAPHLLVAGTTGSGKSVGVNSMILSMLYKATPEDVRMIMIDPKMLELSIYEGIAHLLTPVVTDMKLASNALTWCVNEMEKRYRLMSHVGVRNLEGYNHKICEAAARGQKIPNPFSFTPDDAEPLEKLPFIVVIVDEFADLMMVAGKQIEQLIARLAQKARAAGIHLILATQRPSVDVITGLIKANIPTRIAFQVSTKIDSRTILDQMGAENLLGQGDMLFLPPGTGYPQRVHGAFVGDHEVHAVVDYLKQFGAPDYIDDILMAEQEEFHFGNTGSNERDALFDQAADFIIRSQKTSISAIQRHLRIGYNKAAIIMEQLEEEGIVSAADHSGKRTILARNNTER